MGGTRHFGLRAFIFMLRFTAALVLLFGIGGWLVVTVMGLLAPTVVTSNPTMNDLALNTFDLMPDVRTGYAELDESMTMFRNLGRVQVPVRETVTIFGLAVGLLGLFRLVGSALFGFLLWALADYLNTRLRRMEEEEDARQSAYFRYQYSQPRLPVVQRPNMTLPPPPPMTYYKPSHPSLRQPPAAEPTPLEQYLKRQQKRR
jgi:type IV secretory pathway TrbD component